jgi:hypothetical protein
MAALSDYLESGILNHLFRTNPFEKPSNISIALTSSVAKENDTGSTIPELPENVVIGVTTFNTNYSRVDLGSPSQDGNSKWNAVGHDTSTAFSVYTQDVEEDNFFYPLYLSETVATSQDTNTQAKSSLEYTFSEHPGISFFGPLSVTTSGSVDPGLDSYEGNGFIKNNQQIVFNTATTDWGWVSGVAILDSSDHQGGNLLMYAALNNPRYVYTGDNIKFDINALEINLN